MLVSPNAVRRSVSVFWIVPSAPVSELIAEIALSSRSRASSAVACAAVPGVIFASIASDRMTSRIYEPVVGALDTASVFTFASKPTGIRCPSATSTWGAAVPSVLENGGVAVSLASRAAPTTVGSVFGTGGLAVSCPAKTYTSPDLLLSSCATCCSADFAASATLTTADDPVSLMVFVCA